ncbi:hypothetical protein QFZ51_000397 [Chitinophaga sp. W3I9]
MIKGDRSVLLLSPFFIFLILLIILKKSKSKIKVISIISEKDKTRSYLPEIPYNKWLENQCNQHNQRNPEPRQFKSAEGAPYLWKPAAAASITMKALSTNFV